MKKLLIFFLLIPLMVSAKSNYLYDDLMNDAISNNQLEQIDDKVYIFKGGTSNNLANYVKFNNELWRIMGIYNNQLKIIHANSIGQHQFDYGNMKITYPNSELSNYLNGEYLDSISSNDKSMIDLNGLWYIGEAKMNLKASEAYANAKKTTHTDTIGIMATYEFLYASNGDDCYDVSGSSYSNNCGKTIHDWLTPAEHDAWTLTPHFYVEDGSRGVPLNISPSGYVSYGSGNASSLWIYPALYLKSNIKLEKGTGTSNDPYILDFYYANSINVEDKAETESIDFDIDDLTEVEYKTEVKFSIKAKDGYILKDIKILDNNNEEIEYINNNGEYKFIMPNSDVIITPIYEKEENKYEFVEGMGQTFDVVNDSRLRFSVNMKYDDFIVDGNVYIDREVVDKKYYELSKDSSSDNIIIIFNDEYSKKLKLGKHQIVTMLSNGETAVTDFSIDETTFKGLMDNPITGDKVVIILVTILLSFEMIILLLKKKVFRYHI